MKILKFAAALSLLVIFSPNTFAAGEHSAGHENNHSTMNHGEGMMNHGEGMMNHGEGMMNHGGGKMKHGGGHWMSPPAEAGKKNPVGNSTESVAQGKMLYSQYCSSCHGPDAEGDGPAASALNPKPTNLKMMSGHHPDGDFAWKIKNGRGAMPAWDKTLNDTQVWHLVNYIQSLK